MWGQVLQEIQKHRYTTINEKNPATLVRTEYLFFLVLAKDVGIEIILQNVIFLMSLI